MRQAQQLRNDQPVKLQGSLSVVVPAYNEADDLQPVVAELVEALEDIATDYEVIIVDDGSCDDTGQIADELAAANPRVRALHHQTNRGQGAALITGFSACSGEWITSISADGQIDPGDLRLFVGVLDEADFVTSYYLDRDDGFQRRVLTWGLRTLMRLMFGKMPRLEGTRMFRRELLDTVGIQSRTGLANLEFVLKASRMGYRIKEVGIHCRPRLSGKSKVKNLRTIGRFLWEIFRLRLIGLGNKPREDSGAN